MARLPYTGAPDVSADPEAANDYQHTQASGADFGSQVGAAVSDVGQSVGKLSDFYGEVAADNATNDLITKNTAVLRGDPSQGPLLDADGNQVQGPNGGPVYKGGYFGLQGADAMSAREEVGAQLDENAQAARASLTTPEAQHQFDTQSRRYRAQADTEIGQHYDTQYKQWMVNTASTSSELAESTTANNIDNPTVLAQSREDLRQAEAKKYTAQYGTPDQAGMQGVLLHADQKWALAQLRGAGDNGLKAQAILDQPDVKTALAAMPNYDQIVRQTDGLVYKQVSAPLVRSAISGDVADATRLIQGGAVTAAPGGAPGAAPSTSPNANNLGNVRSGPNGFAAPATPMDGVLLTANNLRNGYRGLTLAQIAQKWAPASDHNDPAGWAANVARTSGLDQNAVPDLNNPQVLTSLVRGIGIAEKKSADLTPFTNDVISQGVTASIAGQHPNLSGGVQGGAAPQYATLPDALEATAPQRVEAFRQQAEQQFGPTHPDWVENATNEYRRQLDQTVTDQRNSYKVYTNVVQQQMASDNPPKSESDLMARGPQVAAAWNNMKLTNPNVAEAMTHRWNEEAKSTPLAFGANFKDYADRALAPAGAPNAISDPMELNNFVGSGEGAPLTTAGQNQLAQIMALRSTPQGEAFVGRVRNFMNYMHGELTYSNANAGQFDPKGEQLFARASAQVLPNIMTAYKNGTSDKVLDPNSPDFLGKVVQSMARPPAQMMKDRVYGEMSDVGMEKKFGTPATQGYVILHDAVQQGRLTARQAAIIAAERGYKAPSHVATTAVPPGKTAAVTPAAPATPGIAAPAFQPQEQSPDSEG